jgi:hypothetical protein
VAERARYQCLLGTAETSGVHCCECPILDSEEDAVRFFAGGFEVFEVEDAQRAIRMLRRMRRSMRLRLTFAHLKVIHGSFL